MSAYDVEWTRTFLILYLFCAPNSNPRDVLSGWYRLGLERQSKIIDALQTAVRIFEKGE